MYETSAREYHACLYCTFYVLFDFVMQTLFFAFIFIEQNACKMKNPSYILGHTLDCEDIAMFI